jgi:hypothetical protein
MFIFVVQTLQNKWKIILHEITSWWKTYAKRLFSKDLEIQDVGLRAWGVLGPRPLAEGGALPDGPTTGRDLGCKSNLF